MTQANGIESETPIAPRPDQGSDGTGSDGEVSVEQRELRQRIDENWRSLVRAAGNRYVGCRLKNFKIDQRDQKVAARQRIIVDELVAYCKTIQDRRERCEGIVLYGPVGTGKDHLAFSVARAIVGIGQRVQWIRGQTWFGDLRDGMDSGVSEARTLDEFVLAPWLVLSDPLPPSGSLTTYQTSMLFRAVDERYSKGRPTIITINVFDSKEADSRLGAAVWDRLCHGAYKLQCQWGSYRSPAKEVNFT